MKNKESISIDKIIESLKEIHPATAGCSIRTEISAYYILKYLKTGDQKELADQLYEFTEVNEYEITYNILEEIFDNCQKMLLGEKTQSDNVKLEKMKLNFNDVTNFFYLLFELGKVSKYDFKINNSLFVEYLGSFNDSVNKLNTKVELLEDRINRNTFDSIGVISFFVAIITLIFSGINNTKPILDFLINKNIGIRGSSIVILGLAYILSFIVFVLLTVINQNSKKKVRVLIIIFAFFSIMVISLALIICKMN